MESYPPTQGFSMDVILTAAAFISFSFSRQCKRLSVHFSGREREERVEYPDIIFWETLPYLSCLVVREVK